MSPLTQACSMVADLETQNLSSDTVSTIFADPKSIIKTPLTGSTNIEPAVGDGQSNITSANSRLSTQVGDLENVNTDEAPMRVTDLKTQIETACDLAAQTAQLTLVKHL
jgi:hypothetical protein